MLIILIPIIVLIVVLIILKHKKIINKIKTFLKKCKWVVILEFVIIIFFMAINFFDKTVIIKEKDPHTNEVLKYSKLKEGETYIYYTLDLKNFTNFQEKANTIKIKNINIDRIKVFLNNDEKEYKYGSGFSYYGPKSCNCGTPITFEKNLTNTSKIIFLSILIIDIFIIIFIKEDKEHHKLPISN